MVHVYMSNVTVSYCNCAEHLGVKHCWLRRGRDILCAVVCTVCEHVVNKTHTAIARNDHCSDNRITL